MLTMKKIRMMSRCSWANTEDYYLLYHGIVLNGEGNGDNGGSIGTYKRVGRNNDIYIFLR